MATPRVRAELSARILVVCLAVVTVVAGFDLLFGARVVLTGALICGPFLAAAYLAPRWTGLVVAYAVGSAVGLGVVNQIFGTVDHLVRVSVVAVAGALSVWLAGRRVVRERQLAASERKLAIAQTSAELGQRLRLALAAGRMGTWVWDRDTGRVLWDEQLESLWGLPPGGFTRTFEAYVAALHPDDRDEVLATVRRAVAAGASYRVQHRVVWPDGSVHWLESRGEVVRDDSGAVVGTTGVSVDVTDRKRSELDAERADRLTDEVLGLRELFAPDLTVDQVALAGCRAGRRLFECDSVSYWHVERDRVRLVRRDPTVPDVPIGTAYQLASLHPLAADLASLRPHRIATHGGDGGDEDGDEDGEAGEAGERRLLRRLGTAVSVRAPIVIAGEAAGFLALGWRHDVGAPSDRLLSVIERFSGQVALAIEQAQRRAAQAEVTELTTRLQTGLLPATAVSSGEFAVTSHYRPGEERLLLGGDFFDVMPLDDGSLAFVIGDVSGHGPEAAALGASIRASWAALALVEPDPEATLHALNRLVAARCPGEEMFVTVAAGLIDPTPPSIRYALAGHPAPVLLDGDGARIAPESPGPPLGLFPEAALWTAEKVPLYRPWKVLLFTDGLIEGRAAPGSSRRWGWDGLLGQLAVGTPLIAADDVVLAELVAAAETANGDALPDDVAAILLSPAPARKPATPES